MNDNVFFVLDKLLSHLKIMINRSELKLQIESHPSYPSLHAITGVLDHFNIENLALEVLPNLETLSQLPKFFIALIDNENDKEFSVIVKRKNSVEVISGDKKKTSMPVDNFLSIWDGIIVAVEKNEFITKTKQTNNPAFINSLYILSGFFILAAFFFAKPTLFSSLHFVLSLVGIFISLQIIKHEFGFRSKIVNKFCTANKSTSCDAALNSKGATILKHYKLSDISLIYFIGLTLSWIIFVNISVSIVSIITISLFVIPATLYSIYYQYFVIKKWCPLCLVIVAVLWLQCCSLFTLNGLMENITLSLKSGVILFFSFILTAALWLFIKPLIIKRQDLEKLQIKHYKFKRNFDLFNAIYSKGKVLNTQPVHESEIILGNKNAPLHILLVTNPQCYFCKTVHTDIEKLLKKHPNHLKVTLRFSINVSDKNNIAYKVTSRLLELYNTKPETIFANALHNAYKNDVNLDNWIKHWKNASHSFDTVLEKQQTWCHDNDINFTPALYINGKEFPKEYERSDISYFIEDLIEYNSTINTSIESDSIAV